MMQVESCFVSGRVLLHHSCQRGMCFVDNFEGGLEDRDDDLDLDFARFEVIISQL